MAKPSSLPSATTFGPNDFLIGNDGDAASRKTRKFSYSVLSSFVQSVASGEAGASVTWDEIADKPTEFTPSTHSHPVSEVTGLQTILDSKLETVAWGDVTGKPTAFFPSVHSHSISQVSGLQTALDGKASSSHSHAQSDITGLTAALAAKLDDAPNDGTAYARQSAGWVAVSTGGGGTVAWDDVTGKPTTFTPATHTHTASEITDLSTTLGSYLPLSAGTTKALTDVLVLPAPGSSKGSLRYTTGSISGTPVDGDTWMTTQYLTIRIQGASKSLAFRSHDSSFAAKQTFTAATTSTASINLPHGTAPTSPSNGDVWTTTAGVYVRINGTTVGPLTGTANGSVINSVYAEYTTNVDLTAAIPADDTIPQITEGTEVLSVSITPSSATSKIRIRFQGAGAMAGAGAMIGAIFQSGVSDALRATITTVASGYSGPLVCEREVTAGSTSSRTYSVRVGPAGSGTMRLNGSSSGRLFGGAYGATLVVEEIKA